MTTCPSCGHSFISAEEERLQERLDELYSSQGEMEAKYQRRIRGAQAEAERQRQEREDADYLRERATKQLEHAREVGDEMEEERALTKLRRGW